MRAKAEVALPKILGDGMVLQRNQAVPIWGSASPGEEVKVSFAGQVKSAHADSQGNWRVNLDPLAASATPRDMAISGTGDPIQIHDVLVGEVWLCSGQSNMEMPVAIGSKPNSPVAASTDKELAEDVKAGSFPGIRLFRVEKVINPPDVTSAGWSECRGDAIAKFSAIGYIFARELNRELKVPIGMIQSAWGGTRIEVWTPSENNQLQPQDGVVYGRNFAAMIRPLIPYAIRGALWYQGESNLIEGNDGIRYADKMQALINSWRAAWSRPDLPFFFVQIAPLTYSKRRDKISHPVTALPELWEAQELALKIPNTGFVPTLDLVKDLRQLHPQEKRPVADRLCALALAEIYGRKSLVHSGPIFDRMEIRGNTASVHFRGVAGGLKCRDDQPLTGFEIAGEDGTFLPAQASIANNDTVIVSSQQVGAPQAVRFGWSETAQPNLMNAGGWPAYPFRTNGPQWEPRP